MLLPQIRFLKQCVGYGKRCHIAEYFIFERINEVVELALLSDSDFVSILHATDVIRLSMWCGDKT